MTNIVRSKFKASRRLKTAIWGSEKDAFNKKNYPPGQHGRSSIKKPSLSDFREHLLAKQLVKSHYGRINSNQFKRVFLFAKKKKGNVAENFASLLERRIDMALYRMNFAPTIFSARQMVSHGHIRLNGKKVNIPSINLCDGDVVELKENSKNIVLYKDSFNAADRVVPPYLSVDVKKMIGKFLRAPNIDEIPYPFEPDFSKIVEYYSR